MKRLCLAIMLIFTCGYVYATQRIVPWATSAAKSDTWSPPKQNIGLFTNFRMNSGYADSYIGAPVFSILDIREIWIQVMHNGNIYDQYLPIRTDVGFNKKGSLVKTNYQSTSVEWEQYSQSYTFSNILDPNVPAKELSLSIRFIWYANGVLNNEPGQPQLCISASLTWKNGVPNKVVCYKDVYDIYGNGMTNDNPSGTAGFVLVMNYDPYNSPLTSAANIAINGLYLRPYDVKGAGPYVEKTQWGNAKNKVLARFFDTRWRSLTEPTYDIYWVDNVAWKMSGEEQIYYMYLADNNVTPKPFYYNNFQSGNVPQLSQECPNNTVVWLTKYTPANGGKDQTGAFMIYHGGMSTTAACGNTLLFYAQKKKGMRSLQVKWFYTNSEYSDENYQVNQNGTSQSVKGVLNELLTEANNTQQNDVRLLKYSRNLTCPDNNCELSELYALESANYPYEEFQFSRLNSAVYVLSKDQKYFETTTLRIIKGLVVGANSRAFVFPREAQSSNEAYLTISHEIGHTLGMNHQWSNCTCYEGFNCNKGTVMSLSTTKIMQYGYEATRWYANAPIDWIDPRWGFGPTPDVTTEPMNILDWVRPW